MRRNVLGVLIVVLSLLTVMAYPLFLAFTEDDVPLSSSTLAVIEFAEVLRPTSDASVNWDTVYPASPTTHFDKVDETTVGGDGDTTYISTATDTDLDRFGMSDMSEIDRGDATEIDGVTLWVRAKKHDLPPSSTFTMGIYNNTVYYPGLSAQTLTTSYVNYTHTYTVNPATSLPWTIAQVDLFQTYVSTADATPNPYITQIALLVPGRQYVWPPTFTSSPDTTALAANHYTYTATANESSTFALAYSTPDPWFTFTPANATLWGTPSVSDVGEWTVNISALSGPGEQTAYQNFTITVDSWVPTFTSTPPTNAAFDYLYNYSYETNESCTFDVTLSGSIETYETTMTPLVETTQWLNDTWAYYTYHSGDAPPDSIYLSGNNVWDYDRLLFYKLDLTSLPADATLTSIAIDQYLVPGGTAPTATNPVTVNVTNPWSGAMTNTSFNGIWAEGDLKTLTPATTYVSTESVNVPASGAGWKNLSIDDASDWQAQFDDDGFIYIHITGWQFASTAVSHYLNATSTRFDIEYTTWLPSGDSENIFQYKTSESSDTVAYIPWDNFDYGTYNLLSWSLTDIPEGSVLSNLSLDVYQTYDNTVAGTPELAVNASGAFGGTSGGLVRTQADLEALMPDGSFAFMSSGYYAIGGSGWYEGLSGDAHSTWQTQFETNRTIYMGFTIYPWATSYDGSFGQNLSSVVLNVTYYTPGGWLSWDSVDDYINGTPVAGNGSIIVSIEATNAVGGIAYQNFTVTPGDGWMPTFTSSPVEAGSAEILYEYTATCNETVTWPADDSIATNATFLYWGQSNHTVYGTPGDCDINQWFYVNVTANSTLGYLTGWQNYTVNITEYDVTPPTAIAEWGYVTDLASFIADGYTPTSHLNLSSYGSHLYLMVSGTYSYDNIGITNYTWNWTVDGGPLNQDFDGFIDAFDWWTPGYYDFSFTVRDAAGLIDTQLFSFTIEQSDVLRPNETVSVASWTSVGDVHLDCVDDNYPWYDPSGYPDVHDSETTYIAGDSDVDTGLILFETQDWYQPGVNDEDYDIDVTLYFWAKSDAESPSLRAGIYYGSNYYSLVELTNIYANYTITWEEAPWTSLEWTPECVNITRMSFRDLIDGTDTHVTMCGLVVTYTAYDFEDPVANAGPDQSVDEGDTVHFTGAGSTDNVGIVNYTWAFVYDGDTVYLYGVSPSYPFLLNGTYTVTLEVTDAASNVDDDTMTVTVTLPSPSFAEQVYGNMGTLTLIIMGAIGLLGMICTPAFYLRYGRDDKQRSFVYAIFWFVLFFGFFYASIYAFY